MASESSAASSSSRWAFCSHAAGHFHGAGDVPPLLRSLYKFDARVRGALPDAYPTAEHPHQPCPLLRDSTWLLARSSSPARSRSARARCASACTQRAPCAHACRFHPAALAPAALGTGCGVGCASSAIPPRSLRAGARRAERLQPPRAKRAGATSFVVPTSTAEVHHAQGATHPGRARSQGAHLRHPNPNPTRTHPPNPHNPNPMGRPGTPAPPPTPTLTPNP